jgi:hypothetical protein
MISYESRLPGDLKIPRAWSTFLLVGIDISELPGAPYDQFTIKLDGVRALAIYSNLRRPDCIKKLLAEIISSSILPHAPTHCSTAAKSPTR